MLPYVKHYATVAYALGIIIPIGFITGLSWFTGIYLPSSMTGILVSVVILLVCLLSAKSISNRMANNKVEKILSLYNDGCDPRSFVEAGKDIAERIQPPYEENSSWYLSYYALALDDVGNREEAVHVGQTMLSSAQRSSSSSQKVALLINIEPLVLRLFGVAQALDVVNTALHIVKDSQGVTSEEISFLTWEKETLEALRDGRDEVLLSRYSMVKNNSSSPMRMRVSYALLEATIYKAQGNYAAEQECLHFIIQNGNRLPAVNLAQARLQELRS